MLLESEFINFGFPITIVSKPRFSISDGICVYHHSGYLNGDGYCGMKINRFRKSTYNALQKEYIFCHFQLVIFGMDNTI